MYYSHLIILLNSLQIIFVYILYYLNHSLWNLLLFLHNILYIITKCKNNHKEKKQISDFLKENIFTIDNNFDIYDLVPSNVRKKEENLDEDPVKFSKKNYLSRTIRYGIKYKVPEIYLICFKCKKIYDAKIDQLDKLDKLKHQHPLFEYYIITNGFIDINDDSYEKTKHFLKFKDFRYVEKKIEQERKYYSSINDLLIKNNLQNKYVSILNQLKSEIDFFIFYYEQYKKQKTKRNFQNLSNIFNHTLLLFKLDNKDNNKNDNDNLRKNIEKINNELVSFYSRNSFNNEEKINISKYKEYTIKPPGNVYTTTSLDEFYFAAGGVGLYIYKIDKNLKKNEEKLYKITLISKVENVDINTMIYLGNQKIIVGGNKGFLLITFNRDYKSYKINFHIFKNEEIYKIIKTYDNYFISYGINIPICKWAINKQENNIEKLLILNPGNNILGLCEINNKYFAFQTEDFIYIINYKTFKTHIKIKYRIQGYLYRKNEINKITDNIIGTIGYNSDQIDFFNIETGEKLFEINKDDDDNQVFYRGFLRSKRAKEETEIIFLCENFKYMSNDSYCLDAKLDYNKLDIMSRTLNKWYIKPEHIFEMNDLTILISGNEEIYVLFYPY